MTKHNIEIMDQELMAKKFMELRDKYNILAGIVEAISITGPDEENKIWLKVEHKDMKGGVGLSLIPHLMSGRTMFEFGKLVDEAKRVCDL